MEKPRRVVRNSKRRVSENDAPVSDPENIDFRRAPLEVSRIVSIYKARIPKARLSPRSPGYLVLPGEEQAQYDP
jgi:hypothetical protein